MRPTDAAEQAVDPRLSVLRIDRRPAGSVSCLGGAPLGVLAVYGMHPTGIPNTNELYHGDIFGFAVRTAEACLAAAASAPVDVPLDQALQRSISTCQHSSGLPAGETAALVVGLANGVEGDVSPKLDFQSTREARKLGRALGVEIARAAAGVRTLRARGPLDRAYWELTFPGARADDDPSHDLCPDAALGMAAAGGARDGPTRLRVIPAANAGYKPPLPSGCHGFKLPLREAFESNYDFPRWGPIGLLQIGDGFVATAPGEMTTITGERIRIVLDGVLTAGARRGPLALVGLTNQYLQYFSTREEYDFQYYEGASTLYGPYTERFLERHFECLAHAFLHQPFACGAQPPVDSTQAFDPSPSPQVRRWPEDSHEHSVDTTPPTVQWVKRDGVVGWEMTIGALPLIFTSDRGMFRVEVLREPDSGVPVDDDRGSSIEFRETSENEWRIRWIPDLRTPSNEDGRCGQSFRLAVRGRVNLVSRPFRLDCDAVAGPVVP
jgi:neutral ceramidase